ncbi:hypothetical protein [Leptolyngbya ohadii]|uniref:hypothetical protein n=1 Tax=Leptolyngbya ohadii TaxID=1962290 RepID=UPI000B599721|nr:hypothetical protein [Leptolyngbya ohadii]
MSQTNAKKQEFVRLIDQALRQSEDMIRQNSTRTEQLKPLMSELQRIKAEALDDRLPPSQEMLTLGLTRGLADWIEPLDSPLMNAVGAVELYYQQQI